jgi:hypothetical protein
LGSKLLRDERMYSITAHYTLSPDFCANKYKINIKRKPKVPFWPNNPLFKPIPFQGELAPLALWGLEYRDSHSLLPLLRTYLMVDTKRLPPYTATYDFS